MLLKSAKRRCIASECDYADLLTDSAVASSDLRRQFAGRISDIVAGLDSDLESKKATTRTLLSTERPGQRPPKSTILKKGVGNKKRFSSREPGAAVQPECATCLHVPPPEPLAKRGHKHREPPRRVLEPLDRPLGQTGPLRDFHQRNLLRQLGED